MGMAAIRLVGPVAHGLSHLFESLGQHVSIRSVLHAAGVGRGELQQRLAGRELKLCCGLEASVGTCFRRRIAAQSVDFSPHQSFSELFSLAFA